MTIAGAVLTLFFISPLEAAAGFGLLAIGYLARYATHCIKREYTWPETHPREQAQLEQDDDAQTLRETLERAARQEKHWESYRGSHSETASS